MNKKDVKDVEMNSHKILVSNHEGSTVCHPLLSSEIQKLIKTSGSLTEEMDMHK